MQPVSLSKAAFSRGCICQLHMSLRLPHFSKVSITVINITAIYASQGIMDNVIMVSFLKLDIICLRNETVLLDRFQIICVL